MSYPHNINYESDFIRGFFEGDGCISLSKGKYAFSILALNDFNSELQKVLMKEVGLHKTKLSSHKCGYINYMTYSGQQNVSDIGFYLYQNVFRGHSKLFMNRKLMRFVDLWSLGYLPTDNNLLETYKPFIKDNKIDKSLIEKFIGVKLDMKY